MLPPQLHLGLPHLDALVVDAIYTQGKFSKPWGGLWTSTFTSGSGSAWLAYRASQEFTPGPSHPLSLWLLTPDANARILTIDTPADIERLFDAYSLPLSAPRSPGSLGLNWPRLALDFDAFHLTQAGFEADYPLFSTWSCESTLWFRDCFAQKQKLLELTWAQAFDLSRAGTISLESEISLL
jgi:hypothetical protein